ncbi:MAG: RNA 2',3'-cyclic phosphodiesterase [Thermodesulfobacteriota bacterium]|nr:RNA 2',3'-cyclic phosphodiesterase [Thermodesulfobacteriota bacterium]
MGYNSRSNRLFLAFDLPGDVAGAVSEIQQQIREHGLNIKWVSRRNLHLTVKFLGDVSPDGTKQVKAAALSAVRGLPPVAVRVKGVGVFPDMRRPRVLWVGLSGDVAMLTHCHDRLDEQLEKAGFERDQRRFNAHITMGRIKGRVDTKQLATALEPFFDFQAGAFAMDRLVLYKSDLQPAGPVYTKIETFALEGGKASD